MRFLHVLLLCLMAAVAGPAAASITLRYAADEPSNISVVIEADDAGNIRAEHDNGQLLMILGDQTYLVVPRDGQMLVVRFEDFLSLLVEMRRPAPGASPAPQPARLVERGPERVGQWQGTLYWVEPLPPADARLRSEYVIAADSALASAGRLFTRVETLEARIFQAAFNLPESEHVAIARRLLDSGLTLRIAGRYRLEAISDAPVPAERFRLPGPVLSREEYRARVGQ